MAKKKEIKIPEMSGLEVALRNKYNQFMMEHREQMHEYANKRQMAESTGEREQVIATDDEYQKLRDKVSTALLWKKAFDELHRNRMRGIDIKPKHAWWAYLIDETLEEEEEEKSPIIILPGKQW